MLFLLYLFPPKVLWLDSNRVVTLIFCRAYSCQSLICYSRSACSSIVYLYFLFLFLFLVASSSFFLHTLKRQYIIFINTVYLILFMHSISSLTSFVKFLWFSFVIFDILQVILSLYIDIDIFSFFEFHNNHLFEILLI